MPASRSRSSKHVYSQPQLLVLLCLRRFEGWTYREAQVRLGEHRELRRALRLRQSPRWTPLRKSLARRPEGVFQRALEEAATRLLPPRPPGPAPQAITAADATGLRTSRASGYFVRRLRELGIEHPRRAWLKRTLLGEVRHQAILAQRVSLGPRTAIPDFPPLVRLGRKVEPLAVVLADAGFNSEATTAAFGRGWGQ